MNRANGRQYIGDIRDGMENCAIYHDCDGYIKEHYGARKMGIVYGIVAGAYNYDFDDIDTMVEVQSKFAGWNDTIEKYYKKGVKLGMTLNKHKEKRNLYRESE